MKPTKAMLDAAHASRAKRQMIDIDEIVAAALALLPDSVIDKDLIVADIKRIREKAKKLSTDTNSESSKHFYNGKHCGMSQVETSIGLGKYDTGGTE